MFVACVKMIRGVGHMVSVSIKQFQILQYRFSNSVYKTMSLGRVEEKLITFSIEGFMSLKRIISCLLCILAKYWFRMAALAWLMRR